MHFGHLVADFVAPFVDRPAVATFWPTHRPRVCLGGGLSFLRQRLLSMAHRSSFTRFQ